MFIAITHPGPVEVLYVVQSDELTRQIRKLSKFTYQFQERVVSKNRTLLIGRPVIVTIRAML